jgi:photosystem II stability/assembly factor-like uncharacterized protein
MKRSILFLFILMSFHAVAQWVLKNPLPQPMDLNAVHFINPAEGWAVGRCGTVMHTIDGGANWQILSLGTTDDFEDIMFIGADTGWMVGYNMIYRTTDGGQTWNLPESPLPIDACSVCFINSSEGWVAGGSYFTILHTMDGGETWEEQDSGLGSEFGRLYSIYFIDENNGWACGFHNLILKTTNGGNSWSKIGEQQNESLSNIIFFNNQEGIISSTQFILRSFDGGESWEQLDFDLFYIYGMYFTDQLTGYVCGNDGNIARTINGGTNWTIMETDANMHLFDIQILENGYGYTSGELGRIQSFDPDENRWKSLTSGINSSFRDIHFLNESEGWIAGLDLYHSTDGGTTWLEQIPEDGARIYSVYFTDSFNGWCTSLKKIFRTSDGGESWRLQLDLDSVTVIRFEKIYFPDTLHGWALDFYGLLYHTNDGGENWEQQNSGILNIQQNSIFALDSLHAWISGGYGMISRTTDGGKHWTAIYTGSQWSMNWDIQFTDELHGWTIDDGVFYTEDGGLSWTKICNEYDFYGWNFHFIDPYNGWMVTQSDDGVARTMDGGYTWELQSLPYCSRVLNVWFSDENNGWAVGTSGIILHTDNGGTVGTEEFKVHPPAGGSKFKVECYPNPLSDEVTIGYEIVEPSMVKLEIYNYSGQLIEVLASEKQYPGHHQFNWNAASFQPGLYLYKLAINQSQTSGKLILVK